MYSEQLQDDFKVLLTTLNEEIESGIHPDRGTFAVEQGVDTFISDVFVKKSMVCPYCSATDKIFLHGKSKRRVQRYFCTQCTRNNGGKRRTFLETVGTPTYHVHHRLPMVLLAKEMIDSGTRTLKATADYYGISIGTAHHFRHKIGSSSEAVFEENADSLLVKLGVCSLPHMEKGGSNRGVDSLYVNGSSEICTVSHESNNKHLNTVEKKKVSITNTFTLLELKLDASGKLHAPLYSASAVKKQLKELLSTTLEKVNEFRSELLRFFNTTFHGISTRYVQTYIRWFLLTRSKVSLFDTLSKVLTNTDSRKDFMHRYKESITEQKAVQYYEDAA